MRYYGKFKDRILKITNINIIRFIKQIITHGEITRFQDLVAILKSANVPASHIDIKNNHS